MGRLHPIVQSEAAPRASLIQPFGPVGNLRQHHGYIAHRCHSAGGPGHGNRVRYRAERGPLPPGGNGQNAVSWIVDPDIHHGHEFSFLWVPRWLHSHGFRLRRFVLRVFGNSNHVGRNFTALDCVIPRRHGHCVVLCRSRFLFSGTAWTGWSTKRDCRRCCARRNGTTVRRRAPDSRSFGIVWGIGRTDMGDSRISTRQEGQLAQWIAPAETAAWNLRGFGGVIAFKSRWLGDCQIARMPFAQTGTGAQTGRRLGPPPDRDTPDRTPDRDRH